jgi:excisionase family DNA binding protein
MNSAELRWLSFLQARRRLALSRLELLRLIDAGQVPAYRIGRRIRLQVADVEAYRARREG